MKIYNKLLTLVLLLSSFSLWASSSSSSAVAAVAAITEEADFDPISDILFSASHLSVEGVEAVLKKGADIDEQRTYLCLDTRYLSDWMGATPLIMAVVDADKDILSLDLTISERRLALVKFLWKELLMQT